MKKVKFCLSLFMTVILMFTMSTTGVSARENNFSEFDKIEKIIIKSEDVYSEDIYINGNFYTKEEFLNLLEQSIFSEDSIINDKLGIKGNLDSNQVSSFSVTGTLIAGTWYIPGVGQVVITTAGVIIIGGSIIAAGTWLYNTVSTYFAEKSYEKAKKDGTKTENHSTKTSTSGDSSLPTTGAPLSSKDLKDSQGVKQRRYYDKNGKADLDIDYRHAGNYKFPHRHTWSNGKRSGH